MSIDTAATHLAQALEALSRSMTHRLEATNGPVNFPRRDAQKFAALLHRSAILADKISILSDTTSDN